VADREERLRELEAAWRSLPLPPPNRELEDEDPATRQAVEWMRSAWVSLEIPRAPAPPVPMRARRRWPSRLARIAAVLVLALGALLLARSISAPDETEIARTPPTNDTEARQGPDPPPPAVALLAATADRIELRSGPVRLVLLTD